MRAIRRGTLLRGRAAASKTVRATGSDNHAPLRGARAAVSGRKKWGAARRGTVAERGATVGRGTGAPAAGRGMTAVETGWWRSAVTSPSIVVLGVPVRLASVEGIKARKRAAPVRRKKIALGVAQLGLRGKQLVLEIKDGSHEP